MVVSSGGIPDRGLSSLSTPSDDYSDIGTAIAELHEILVKKNEDYRVTSGEFSNFHFAGDVSGMSVHDVMMAQIGIKIGRIKGLKNGLSRDTNFESLEDSIRDLAGYAVLLYAYTRGLNA